MHCLFTVKSEPSAWSPVVALVAWQGIATSHNLFLAEYKETEIFTRPVFDDFGPYISVKGLFAILHLIAFMLVLFHNL